MTNGEKVQMKLAKLVLIRCDKKSKKAKRWPKTDHLAIVFIIKESEDRGQGHQSSGGPIFTHICAIWPGGVCLMFTVGHGHGNGQKIRWAKLKMCCPPSPPPTLVILRSSVAENKQP